MTKNDVISMAQESGMHRQQHNLMSNPVQHRYSYDGYEENLERFAALVAAAAQAKERDACAKVCLDAGLACEVRQGADLCFDLSEAIRARGNT